MKVKATKIEAITPYINNPKIHNERNIAEIAASLKEFGWQQPLVIDNDHTIVVGHGRYFAALKLGMKIVPCKFSDDLTPLQIKAYRIADNKINQNTGFDEELLKLEMPDLKDFNFEAMGYTDEEYNSLFDDMKDFEPNERKDDEFEEELEKYNDSNCKLPIVPDFFEKHECFIIPVHNEIDEKFVRDFFELNSNYISESGDKKIRKTNVINIKDIRCKLK